MTLSLPLSASAQYTLAPPLIPSWLDNSGLVANGFGFCVYQAGTTTLATTYVSATGTANSNPILFSSAGRADVSGSNPETGIWLAPGSSYRFLYVNFTGVGSPSCVGAPNGTTIWSIDNVPAVPASAVNEDVQGTAGESFAAGELGYLSDGSGGKTAGQWFRADADLMYAGSLPPLGFAVAAITSGNTGTFRLGGRLTGFSGLSTGLDYYVSTTVGAVTITPPLQARWVARAESATVLVVQTNPRSTPITPREPCGRLTLTTGTPVTTADVTAATTVFFAPYGGCTSLTLFDGTIWYQTTFAQLSIAVPAVANQMYDVFVYDNAGTPTLELTAWTNDTTRATALTTQNGVYVKTGVLTRLYLGSFRTTAVAGQTEDSLAKRYVWNYYHRVPRALRATDVTNSWGYSSATIRQANGATGNQVDVVVGVAEVLVTVRVGVLFSAAAANIQSHIGIGEDVTNAFTNTSFPTSLSSSGTVVGQGYSLFEKYPAVGRHFYSWNESGDGANTTTFYGDNNDAANFGTSGISGWIEG